MRALSSLVLVVRRESLGGKITLALALGRALRRLLLTTMEWTPCGVVTFLRTDIAGSSVLYQTSGAAVYAAVDRHDRVVGDTIRRYGGVIERTEGDSFFATFARPTRAVAAAFEIQRDLEAQTWPPGVRPEVRIGLHTGEAGRLLPSGRLDARGLQANVCGRVSDLAGGGQILLTLGTAALAMQELPRGSELRYRGVYRLRGMRAAQHIYELVSATEPRGPGRPRPRRIASRFPGSSADRGRSSEMPGGSPRSPRRPTRRG